MDGNNYINKLASKLKEIYSKDDLVSHLVKTEKELRFNIGVLSSEIEELKHNNRRLKESLRKATKSTKEVRDEIKKEALYTHLKEQCESLISKCKRLEVKYNKLLYSKI